MSTLVPSRLPGPRVAAGLIRVVLLLMVAALATASSSPAVLAWLLLLAAIGAVMLLVPAVARGPLRAAPVVEAMIVVSGVVATGGDTSPLLLYLVVPGLAAGLREGPALIAGVLVATEVLLAVGSPGTADPVRSFVVGSAWAVLAALVGAVGWWSQRLLTQIEQRPDQAYVSAYRLLGQLRSVVRHLPTGLDPASTAERLLAQLRDRLGASDGGVWVRGDGDRLTCLAEHGEVRAWQLRDNEQVRDVMVSATLALVQRVAGSSGPVLVLPLVGGGRVTGLAAVAGRGQPWPAARLEEAQRLADESAVRLESALLFDDIRALATTEERHRLAREIHDGVAQDLVFLGYGLDNVLGSLADGEPVQQQIRELREQVGRVVRDLRMSLYDLRSEVAGSAGLGDALADHVREVGRQSGLRVHLELSESPDRLLPDTEAELLRIAQEAIANARKHSGAANLWVTCEVEPPCARLEVRDDGRGLLPGSSKGYGRSIMTERAARIGGRLTVEPGPDGGVVVRVELGGVGRTEGDPPVAARERDAVPGTAR